MGVKKIPYWIAVVILCCMFAIESAAFGFQQDERRNQIGFPGLVRDSDRPESRINVIRQVGDRIYLAGLDHCVFSYRIDGEAGIDWTSVKTYRWPSWGEERGEILILALSDDGSRLALGGIGLITGMVAEFSVDSQKLLRAKEVVLNSVTAMDYGEDGTLLIGSAYGEVAMWDPKGDVISFRKASSERQFVRDVHAGESSSLAVLADGEILSFETRLAVQKVATLAADDGFVGAAQFTKDGKRLLLGRRRNDLRSDLIEYDLKRNVKRFEWRSPATWIVDGVSYTPDQQDFIAYGISDAKVRGSRIEYKSRVHTHFQGKKELKTDEISNTRIAAISPRDSKSFWYAAVESQLLFFSSDGMTKWQSELNESRAERVFWTKDLRGFAWSGSKGKSSFQFDSRKLLPAFNDEDIYRHKEVIQLVPDLSTPSLLAILMSDGSRRPISLRTPRDGVASSHITYEKDGRTFIAVGHRFGVSVFEFLRSGKLQLVRKLIGHRQVVTAIAVSEDRRLMLTAGKDGSICCFTLEPWKYQSELGARFALEGNDIVVDALDNGSPIWETGLSVGDRIQKVQYEGVELSPSQALELLKKFEVGGEFKFVSNDLTSNVSSRILQRPIWKFLNRDNEWILYRYRDYYYDCSLQGDQLVAWYINLDAKSEPIVVSAEKARDRFYQPSKLKDLLSMDSLQNKRIQIPELVPPVVTLQTEERGDQIVINASMSVEANAYLVGEPEELSVWVGDLRVARKKSPDIPSMETIIIDRKLLRNGRNRIVARAYNQFGVRGDSDFKIIEHKNPQPSSQFWGVVMGIQDYRQLRVGSSDSENQETVPDLNWTLNDAEAMEDAFKKNTSHFDQTDVRLLTDSQVTRKNLAEELQRVRSLCRPDDFLVLSFAGHGYQLQQTEDDELRSTFLMLTSESRLASSDMAISTSLPVANAKSENEKVLYMDSLFDELAAIPCRKMVIMDACHSGGAVEMVRALTPDFVVGPSVLTAAGKNQYAVEIPSKMHGIFTAAFLEAIGAKFQTADRNHDQLLSLSEVYTYCAQRVPQIFANSEQFMLPEDFQRGQMPEFWAPLADKSITVFGMAK